MKAFALLIQSLAEDRLPAHRFKLIDLPSGVTAGDIETCLFAVSEDVTDVKVTVLGGGKGSSVVRGNLGKTPS